MADLISKNSSNLLPDDEVKNGSKFEWTRLLKVFKVRIPLWLIAIVVVIVLLFSGYNAVTSEVPANLRPVVTDAKKLDVSVTMCNERVDELSLNVRNEELKLQKRFEDRENVEQATVEIKRENCDK